MISMAVSCSDSHTAKGLFKYVDGRSPGAYDSSITYPYTIPKEEGERLVSVISSLPLGSPLNQLTKQIEPDIHVEMATQGDKSITALVYVLQRETRDAESSSITLYYDQNGLVYRRVNGNVGLEEAGSLDREPGTMYFVYL